MSRSPERAEISSTLYPYKLQRDVSAPCSRCQLTNNSFPRQSLVLSERYQLLVLVGQ